ncbi:hypothetical protein BDD12DRAFT_649770, partial [Trichophaea hybrida]
STLIPKITEYIHEHAQGVFLWVNLVLDELIRYAERGSSEIEIFTFLKSLPKDLEMMYLRIFEKLEMNETPATPNSEIGKRMFELVLFARRPLMVPELQHALAI